MPIWLINCWFRRLPIELCCVRNFLKWVNETLIDYGRTAMTVMTNSQQFCLSTGRKKSHSVFVNFTFDIIFTYHSDKPRSICGNKGVIGIIVNKLTTYIIILYLCTRLKKYTYNQNDIFKIPYLAFFIQWSQLILVDFLKQT